MNNAAAQRHNRNHFHLRARLPEPREPVRVVDEQVVIERAQQLNPRDDLEHGPHRKSQKLAREHGK